MSERAKQEPQQHKWHNKLLFVAEKPFVAKKMKIGKVEKLVTNLKDKTTCAVHIKTLNQASKHGLKSKRYIELLDLDKDIGWKLISC